MSSIEKDTPVKADQIIKSRRKTIALIVQPDGKLIVRAPLHATKAQIEGFIHQKTGWIRQKQALVRGRQDYLPPHQFKEGEEFYFLGQKFPLKLSHNGKPLVFQQAFLLSDAAQKQAREVFTGWYQNEARKIIAERAATYAQKTGLYYQKIRITSARTRWGSCSSKKTLSFSWKLVMAPIDIIDYVIVHELAHLKVPNHSKEFWNLVASILPNYKMLRDWLKSNGKMLNLD